MGHLTTKGDTWGTSPLECDTWGTSPVEGDTTNATLIHPYYNYIAGLYYISATIQHGCTLPLSMLQLFKSLGTA